ncbi:MAG: hypothetical protein H7239_09335 [Flavobacterium sp.]|nr:hypothetical protein [Flavobacterium sp.]
MKNLKNTLGKLATLGFIFGILSTSVGCSSPSSPTPMPATSCNNVNTDFQQIYTNTLASNILYDNYLTMDLVTHEYTFKVNTNRTVCSIGYQGNANLYAGSIPYTIEIYDVTTSMPVYTGNHIFNSAYTDYVSITPTPLNTTDTYKIRRIASNYLGNIGNTIGRICRFNSGPVPYPVNNGDLKILASNFYGTGGPVPNYGIPYIDIVFQ